MSNPPKGFDIKDECSGLPIFTTKFDLLTTVDDPIAVKLNRLPFQHFWRKFLQIKTCFVGTTVSEYTLFPQDILPAKLINDIKNSLAHLYPLLIIKDIPKSSPLLDSQANTFSNDLIESLKQENFILVSGQALAWLPIDFQDIPEYLARLSSARRKDMRRKLKKSTEINIQILKTGDKCFYDEQFLNIYYKLYLNVYDQSEIHFDLLSKEFFTALLQDRFAQGIVFNYKINDQLIGYNICYVVEETLMDKYVGFDYPMARNYNLYYISWFHNLNYALEHGLKRYIAGWTDPEIKAYLGAQFTLTQHAVYVRNPVLRTMLRRISQYFEKDQNTLKSIAKNHE
ncbi:GNAT family N-acetyltransferase [Neisseria sp. Ec49-e6-T10]|uniref:GNAT family N-acetyltransferase n=1 Tax=Neisseria sp. Ec49-e6-T10 TaxID=3140744 RepID=UPI003EB9F9D7